MLAIALFRVCLVSVVSIVDDRIPATLEVISATAHLGGLLTSQAMAIAMLALAVPGILLLARRAKATGESGNALSPDDRNAKKDKGQKKKGKRTRG